MRLVRIDLNFAKITAKPERIRFHSGVLTCPKEDQIDISEAKDGSIVFYYNKISKTAEVTTQDENVGILAPLSCRHLFDDALQLKHIEFDNFYFSETVCMAGMFSYMRNLETVKFVSRTDSNKVFNTDEMFLGCINLREVTGLVNLDLTQVRSAKKMFAWCETLEEIDFSRCRMPRCEYMTYLAYGCLRLKRFCILKDDAAQIKDAVGMFDMCSDMKIEIVDFGKKDGAISREFLSSINEQEDGRYGYYPPERIGVRNIQSSLKALPVAIFGRIWHGNEEKLEAIKEITFGFKAPPKGIQPLDYSAAGDGSVIGWIENKTELFISATENKAIIAPLYCQEIFEPCFNVEKISLLNFDTASTKSFAKMFYYLDRLQRVEMSSLLTQNVVTMESMFEGCISLEKIAGLDSFDTSCVENYSCMFKHCHSISDLDLSGFNKQNQANVRSMISNCPALRRLDITGWSFDSQLLPIIKDFVSYCPDLSLDDIRWDHRKETSLEAMDALFGNLTKLPTTPVKLTEIKKRRDKETLSRYQQKKAKRKVPI